MTPTAPATARPVPDYPQTLGHPRPLWMLFMTEFWERFAFYGMRWALTLYIVAQFFHGDQAGQGYASRTYGSYLALVYASAIFGGYVADRVLGYQRSILVGAAVMGTGLFLVMVPNQDVFLIGLATVIVGNGLFKPNISTMVGALYPQGDARRDGAYTIFYMGINLGAFLSPLVCGPLGEGIGWGYGFATAGAGMILGLLTFIFTQRFLQGSGLPPGRQASPETRLGARDAVEIAVIVEPLEGVDQLQAVDQKGRSGLVAAELVHQGNCLAAPDGEHALEDRAVEDGGLKPAKFVQNLRKQRERVGHIGKQIIGGFKTGCQEGHRRDDNLLYRQLLTALFGK